jgi:hypothetical protein
MAKDKVTSNGGNNQPIKHFSSGVISWSFFDGIWHEQYEIFQKVNFLIASTFKSNFNDNDNWIIGLEMLTGLIAEAKERHEGIWGQAKVEKDEAGGNCISTIKDASETKIMAEYVRKAKKELQGIDA